MANGDNALIDLFLHTIFLLIGMVVVMPTLLPVTGDILSIIMSMAFFEFVTIMLGVLIMAKVTMYIVFTTFFSKMKMNVWLYYLIESTVVGLWVAGFMTGYFNVGLITGTIMNFIVLVFIVFLTGLMAPLTRIVLRGK